MNDQNLDHIIARYHRAQDALCSGDPEPVKQLFSHGDEVTLANPIGPPARGWPQVSEVIDRAAALLTGSDEPMAYEHISGYETSDLAYIVQLERASVRLDGATAPSPVTLRSTTIFRREGDTWKVLHRHADPITTPRDIQSIVDRQA